MGTFVAAGQETPQEWENLASHLLSNGLLLERQNPPRQFSSGFGNLNYLIQVDGISYVLRRPPNGPIPPGANDMKRESRILSQLYKKFPLAPKAIHFCDDDGVLGSPFFLMEYRQGIVIGGSLPAALCDWTDPAGRPVGAHIGDVMIDSLVALHQINPADVGLDTLGHPKGFIERTLKGWIHRVELAWNGSLPKVATELENWLRSRQPDDGPASLIHNDFKLDNMILDPETLEPIAVIDWDMGTRGSAAYDLAVLLSYWTQADDPQVMYDLDQMPTAAHGFQNRYEAAQRYAAQAGRPIDNFVFYRVLATYRLAGVFMQLNRRYREGGTDDIRFAGFADLAEGLLLFARDIANGKAF